MSTVRATRAATEDELYRGALDRLEALAADGAATVEIKSGYGLDLDTEVRMLEVARRLGRTSGLTVPTTLLAAHAGPPEFQGRPDDYIEFVVAEVLPGAVERNLADAVDAFCEGIAFDAAQVARVFEKGGGAWHAGQAARGPTERWRRRRAGRPFRGGLGRSPGVRLCFGSAGTRRRRDGGGAVARRLADPQRNPPPAGRRVPAAQGADRDRHRLQSRHFVPVLSAGGDGACQPPLRLDCRRSVWRE